MEGKFSVFVINSAVFKYPLLSPLVMKLSMLSLSSFSPPPFRAFTSSRHFMLGLALPSLTSQPVFYLPLIHIVTSVYPRCLAFVRSMVFALLNSRFAYTSYDIYSLKCMFRLAVF
uniref:Uncharacterized protein n=1 Tax=Cacopsylla melanoneura TaxID=428564 RepID=A0A8D9FGN4_9HEMI